MPWYVLTCLWAGAYKRVAHVVAVADFLSRYLSGPLKYVLRHVTVHKMC